MVVKVHVTYCGAWGYGAKFRKLATQLEAMFPGKLSVEGESLPGTTGKFEVTVNGKLVHSKAGGAGYVDTSEKVETIASEIRTAITDA